VPNLPAFVSLEDKAGYRQAAEMLTGGLQFDFKSQGNLTERKFRLLT